MPTFCQEYGSLILEMNELKSEGKTMLTNPEYSQDVQKIDKFLDDLSKKKKDLVSRIERLRDYPITIGNGRAIRQIEFQGLSNLSQQVNTEPYILASEIKDNHIKIFCCWNNNNSNNNSNNNNNVWTNLMKSRMKPNPIDIDSIKLFQEMTYLIVSSFSIKDISPISELKKLEILSLEGSTFEDIEPLVQLKRNGGALNTLYLRETSFVEKHPEQQAYIDELRRLEVLVYTSHD